MREVGRSRKGIGVRDVTTWLSPQCVGAIKVVTACYDRSKSRIGKSEYLGGDLASPSGLKERSAPLLPPGSWVRQAFICQTAPHFAFFFIYWATGLTMFWTEYRCVAVTQDAIYVLAGSGLSGGANPTSVVGALPRHTQLGPVSGRWGQLKLLGERYWVKRRFQAEIAAADAQTGFRYAP